MSPPVPLPRIHRLPSMLADQIAAGEVVERPASIVKELVENSLDSGADLIQIQIEHGGIEFIRVTDNGHGIHPEDLELALDRHATSKIRRSEDLAAISSLGFRGEALPSIASVAAFTLTSRAAGHDSAWAIRCAPGAGCEARNPAAHPPGTSVEVSRLFQGLPARRKFLRSERTEYLHVLEIVRRLALSRGNVAFRLLHNGKPVLQCNAGAQVAAARIAKLLGRGFIDHSVELADANHGMQLQGWLGGTELCRSQSDQQHFYLNGRMLRDRRLNHAVRAAFAERVPPGRFPSYLLYLEMDPAAVDVNVHPAKHEVRFHRVRDVHDFIGSAVRRVLETGGNGQRGSGDRFGFASVREPAPVPRSEPGARLGHPVACLHGRFIVTERNGAFLLIDAGAATRVRLEARIPAERAAGGLRMRPLLVPVELDADPAATDALDHARELLRSFGIEMDAIGPGRVRIRGIPVLLENVDLPALVRGVLSLIAARGRQGAVAGDLQSLLVEQGADRIVDGQPAALAARLRAIEELDLDFAGTSCAGIWRTLDESELAALVRGRG